MKIVKYIKNQIGKTFDFSYTKIKEKVHKRNLGMDFFDIFYYNKKQI